MGEGLPRFRDALGAFCRHQLNSCYFFASMVSALNNPQWLIKHWTMKFKTGPKFTLSNWDIHTGFYITIWNPVFTLSWVWFISWYIYIYLGVAAAARCPQNQDRQWIVILKLFNDNRGYMHLIYNSNSPTFIEKSRSFPLDVRYIRCLVFGNALQTSLPIFYLRFSVTEQKYQLFVRR